MGHATETPNIGLPQFADTDKPSWRGDVNGAFTDIDTAHAALVGQIGAKADAASVYTKSAADALLNGKVSKASMPRNVRDYGASPTATPADNAAAIQEAINAAGNGGQVYFPGNDDGTPCVYPTDALTPLIGQRWFTGVQQLGFSGDTGYVGLSFPNLTGAQAGISVATGTGSFTIENMRLQGPGAAAQGSVIGLAVSNATVRLHGVQFYRWGVGAKIDHCYYGVFTEVEFRHNKQGLYLDNCYNFHLYNPQFNCSIDGSTSAWGQALYTTNACMVHFHGGSVENFGVAASPGVRVNGAGMVTFHTTYWESSCPSAVGVDGTTATGSSLTFLDNEVYIDNFAAWVDITGAGSGNLFARNNKFKNAGTTDSPLVYKWGARPFMYVDMAMDNWWGVTNTNAKYRDDTNPQSYMNMHIQDPQTSGTYARNQMEYMARATVFPTSGYVGIPAVATVNRPSSSNANMPLVVGAMVWDVSLGKPVWWNGSTWRDATGAAV